jgi:toxin ParE1/3/4
MTPVCELVWTESAMADRNAIYDYIEAENLRAAAALDERFVQAAKRLARRPQIGRPGRNAGTREFVVNRRYLPVYEIVEDVVRVVAVYHTARQWPPITL